MGCGVAGPCCVYLGGEAGGVQKASAVGKCCFRRAWIRLGRYSGSTHHREPFPLAWSAGEQTSTGGQVHCATLEEKANSEASSSFLYGRHSIKSICVKMTRERAVSPFSEV